MHTPAAQRWRPIVDLADMLANSTSFPLAARYLPLAGNAGSGVWDSDATMEPKCW